MFGVPHNLLFQNLSNKPNIVRIRGYVLLACDICFLDRIKGELPASMRKLRNSTWARTVRQRIGDRYSDSELARACSMTPAGVATNRSRMSRRIATTPETAELFATFIDGVCSYVSDKRSDPAREELEELEMMIHAATDRREEILRIMQLKEKSVKYG
jgi:hypothetical protein